MAPLIIRRMFLFCVLVGTFGLPAAQAQIFGAASGTVMDAQGIAIPGARITVRDRLTAFEQTTLTDYGGQFFIAAIPMGEYIIQIKQTGFENISQPLEVGLGTSPDMLFTMEINLDDPVNVCHSVSAEMEF